MPLSARISICWLLSLGLSSDEPAAGGAFAGSSAESGAAQQQRIAAAIPAPRENDRKLTSRPSSSAARDAPDGAWRRDGAAAGGGPQDAPAFSPPLPSPRPQGRAWPR